MSLYISPHERFSNNKPLFTYLTEEKDLNNEGQLPVDASIRDALVATEFLTGSEDPNFLRACKERIVAVATVLPECSFKTELGYISAKIDRVAMSQNPKSNNDRKRVKVCADKGLAYQAKCAVVRELTAKKPNKTFTSFSTFAQGHPDVGVVRLRDSQSRYEKEQLVEQMMNLSLTRSCIASYPIIKPEVRKVVIKQFFVEDCELRCVASPYEAFTVFRKWTTSSSQDCVVKSFDFVSQLALQQMLALQPLDHHDKNIGARVGAANAYEVLFYDNEFSMYASNELLYYRASADWKADASAYSTLHLVPIHSFLLTLKSAILPLHTFVINRLLETDFERDVVNWLERSVVCYDKQLGKGAMVRLKAAVCDVLLRVENQAAEIQKKQCDYEFSQADLCKKTVELILEEKNCLIFEPIRKIIEQTNSNMQAVLYSLMPRCSPLVLTAFKERLANRRFYLEDCNKFMHTEQRAVLLEILNRKSTPIPTTEKARLLQENNTRKLRENMAKWMIPSYRSIACAMYPLLADTMTLLEAIGAGNRDVIGDYATPLESIVYAYLMRCQRKTHLTFPEFQIVLSAILFNLPNQSKPMQLLKDLYQLMSQKKVPIPHALELEHIFDAALNRNPAFYLDTSGAVQHPSDLIN